MRSEKGCPSPSHRYSKRAQTISSTLLKRKKVAVNSNSQTLLNRKLRSVQKRSPSLIFQAFPLAAQWRRKQTKLGLESPVRGETSPCAEIVASCGRPKVVKVDTRYERMYKHRSLGRKTLAVRSIVHEPSPWQKGGELGPAAR
jgi:hypothetical protein